MSDRLLLGPLPDASTTKMTLVIPTPLRTQLERYCELYSQRYNHPVDVATLVPLMLGQFLARDKTFQRTLRVTARSPKD